MYIYLFIYSLSECKCCYYYNFEERKAQGTEMIWSILEPYKVSEQGSGPRELSSVNGES